MGLDRSRGERPFAPRERELLRLALEGLGWFHRRIARLHGLLAAREALTTRERQVLSGLLSGASEKGPRRRGDCRDGAPVRRVGVS